MKILFDANNQPLSVNHIRKEIRDFPISYRKTVKKILDNSQNAINQRVFHENIARLLPNFGMTRKGVFYGISIDNNGVITDPYGVITLCWQAIGRDIIAIRNYTNTYNNGPRARALLCSSVSQRQHITELLWLVFKKLIPLCMGKNSFGLVGASKVLFAVLPEISLPIDNGEWLRVFKTIDYGDVISMMANEIIRWEGATGCMLDTCDTSPNTTLPSVYNVMAMKAR